MSLIAVVRIRGEVHNYPDVRKTLELLNLTRVNHCVLVQNTPQNMGMVKKVKDYITWGEISKETFTLLMEKRGRLMGNKRLTPEMLKEKTEFSKLDAIVDKLYNGDVKFKDIKELKPVFRLHPPKKGFEKKGIKKTFRQGGVLGQRENIDSLLIKMI
ncbi:MAG: 50S ribosomal protein L30 [Candidatus Diapherotrites archaeon]|nr:50S ribosomal protein L30 [Candidatus Diapherotrites archaeon]